MERTLFITSSTIKPLTF
ncbi:hypothetical protein HPB128_129g1 [Helicobacter pylori B128]|nr:hypothetical protein HPB128_129g1 [Helicobacter pylori B128]